MFEYDHNLVCFPLAPVDNVDSKLAEARIAADFRDVGEIALRAKEYPQSVISEAGALVCGLLTSISDMQRQRPARRKVSSDVSMPKLSIKRTVDAAVSQKVAADLHPPAQRHGLAARAVRLEYYQRLVARDDYKEQAGPQVSPATYTFCMYVDMEPNPYIDELYGSVFVMAPLLARESSVKHNSIAFIQGCLKGRVAQHAPNPRLGQIEHWLTALATSSPVMTRSRTVTRD